MTDSALIEKKGFIPWISRWLFTTNHKDIGTLYLFFSLTMFFVGGIMALIIRAKLSHPGENWMTNNSYNEVVTLHGLVMIFGAIMPAFVGLANWMIPLEVGAPDMALPRMNNWSFWILPFAFAIMLSTLIVPGMAPNFGWTMYAPLSTTFGPPSTDFLIVAIHMMGISSILGAINIIATILNMRTPGMTLMKMPIFCWSWLITSFLLIAAMPLLAGTVTMMLFDRHFGTSFFSAAGGGDPLLYQHAFWSFGHPEVYIMILPGFGIISEVIPTFARKKLFGRDFMIYAIASIAFLSFLVWGHHMFTTGIALKAQLFFMYLTILIAVPTGVKVFNWVATMWRGAMTFETPMLFALAFIFLFTIGGFSGLMLAIVPADIQYHGTYFVVAHFHYVLVAGALFSIMSGIYFWIPKWTGHYYDERLGQIHFWLSFISINMTFFPMHFLGLGGMPRRIADYALPYANINLFCSYSAFIFGLAQLLFLYIIFKTIRGGKPASARVWEGAEGLEWTIPSPAPYHSFQTPPHFE